MATINPLVADLSHWDPADDYEAAAADGLVGVIYKATEGTGYTDDTYVSQRQEGRGAGLLWGSYHFANSSDVNKQVQNFLNYAYPEPDELFALDWEDNGDSTMSVSQAKEWITKVEDFLERSGQCVIYSGNTAKELLGDTKDPFFGARRLWLAQYSTTPQCQVSWEKQWLWQYTDGIYGPTPHTKDGLDAAGVDMNSYADTRQRLIAEWATGANAPAPGPRPPRPPRPAITEVYVMVKAPPNITVNIITSRRPRNRKREG